MKLGRKPTPKHLLRDRIHVTLEPQSLEKLDNLCKRLNLSRGKTIDYMLNQSNIDLP